MAYSSAFGVRHQDGRRRRIEDLHVDARHADPRLHGRRHPGAGRVFAVTITVSTGQPLVGAILFPVGFCMLYLLGFDLLTGVFVLTPLALIDKRPGVTLKGVLRNWGLVFCGNFAGAFTVAVFMAIIFTYGFSHRAERGRQGHRRTSARAAPSATRSTALAGMLTLFVRGMLCNWMVSTGVVGAMISTTRQRQGDRDVDAHHGVLLHGVRALDREHVPVPLGPAAGRALHAGCDYLLWNEIPTVLGNLVGGLAFTGLTLYATHVQDGAEDACSPSALPEAAGLERVAGRAALRPAAARRSTRTSTARAPAGAAARRPRASPSRWPTASAERREPGRQPNSP